MSADNWGICPKCYQSKFKKMKDSYGKVSQEEYLKMINRNPLLDATLREDYEIWTDKDGTFNIIYNCHCEECNFTYKYKFEKNLMEG